MPVLIKGSGGTKSANSISFLVKPTDKTVLSLSGIEDVFKDFYEDIGFCTAVCNSYWASKGYIDVYHTDGVNAGWKKYSRDTDDTWERTNSMSGGLHVTKDGFEINAGGNGIYFDTNATYLVTFTKASAMKG